MDASDEQQAGLFALEAVRVRLRWARRFVTIVEQAIDAETEEPTQAGDEGIAASRRSDRSVGAREMSSFERWYEAKTELPLLTWSTTLAYAFSTLEAFLAQSARVAGELAQIDAPRSVGNPKIEGWMRALHDRGARPRLPPELMRRILSLRSVRNALTHRLALSEHDFSGLARSLALERAGAELRPTAGTVRLALDSVGDLVAAVDYAIVELADRTEARPW